MLSLFGKAGDVISLKQLKSPAGDFFPRSILLDKDAGQMSRYEEITLDLLLAQAEAAGVSAQEAAEKLHATTKPSRSQVESTRARPKRWSGTGSPRV